MDFTDTGTLRLRMETNDYDKQMATLNNQATVYKNNLRDIEKQLGKNSAEYKKTKADLDAVRKSQEDLTKSVKQMDTSKMTFQQLQNYVKQLNKELKSMVPESAQANAQLKKIGEAEAQLKKVTDQARKLREEAAGLAKPGLWSSIKDYMASAFSIAGVQMLLEAFVRFTRSAITGAAEISDAFGDVRKTTGMTTQEVVELNKAVQKIDTRTAQKDLMDIAKTGGQIGIAKEEMLGFVESVDKAVVALGDEFTGGAEEVAASMGTMSKLFKETKDLEAGEAINDIGSAINELGAAGSATGPVVADFTTRIGQLGKLAPAIDQTMGLGAALQELGLTAEIAAGGLTNILLGSTKATAEYAKQIGITEKEFKKLVNSDPNEVILRLAQSFKGLPTDVVVKQMDALGIKSQEATKVMMLLSDKTDMVKEKQALANKAMKEGTSLTNEFNIKNNTFGAQLDKTGKMVTWLAEQLGNFLIPAVLLVTTGFIGLVKALAAVPEFIVENKETFAALGVAIVSLNAANIAAAASALAHAAVEKGRAIATQSVTAAQWLLNAAMTANPIGLVVAAISALVGGFMVWYNHSEKVRAGVSGLMAGLKEAAGVVAQFVKAFLTLDIAGMADVMMNGGKRVGDAFTKGYNDKLKEESGKVVAQHKTTVDKKVDLTQKGAKAAADAEIAAATGAADTITAKDQAALDKRKKAKEKQLQDFRDAEDKYDEMVRKDREKALELLSQMEAENERSNATTSLEIEESKIREKARKRIKDIEDSKADEALKLKVVESINRNAEESLDKVRRDYRDKRIKEEQEAAQKRLEAENFVREQEKGAEMTLLEWREMQAKGSAQKLVAVHKDRVDVELRLTQQKLEAEMIAESQKAVRTITDTEQLATALNAIEERYNIASVMANKKAADEKLAIDRDLHEQKAATLKNYSDMFSSLLQGDVSGFMNAASTMVKGHQTAWQQKLAADQASYEQAGQMAQTAVNFLNDLAQRKAEKAIAEANRERDEKVAILNAELATTEAMIKQSSENIKQVKEAEQNRLAELQRILTSETTTEEQKRDALHKFYSQQLQDMKAAEEQKIMDLQKMANEAKTADERAAMEEKIRMATKESEEKIRLAEEEAEAKATMIDELAEFTADVNATVLKDAERASNKQVKMAEDEAEKKAEIKEQLEDLIATENQKARTKEQAEKKKAWQAQKKADIAAALITGALAVLKALANFFPLNIVLAAVAAVATGVQIAKIKSQPEPSFAYGGTLGFVAQGGKHGNIYGTGGIALVDRKTQREVGEMEGDEAIISAKQTAANWPVIQQMFKNARTAGKTDSPVLPMASGATPMAFRDGGKFESPYWEKGMYLFGSKKKKEAEAAAKQAEQEAAAAQAEADAAMADAMGGVDADTSAYNGIDATDPATMGDTAGASAAHAEAKKQGEAQLKAIQDILAETITNGETLTRMVSAIGEVKQAVNGVEGAVRNVEGAVHSTNTQGKFDQLIGAISNLAA
ncbi:phage tail tape measure protein [Dyadobacter sp. 22481]|uniref:phage tail tape measure protein n=1 Tax=Dyadobacter sp. 22481 TaxID=3453926 RepID=UPI003F829C5B